MSVVPTLKWLPLIPASPAGLKKMAEPSAHGRAAATPARPMVQVFCSYTPNPCASSGAGGAETSEGAPASSNNTKRRITCSPRGRIEVDGESGRDTVALPRIIVKPMSRPAIDFFRDAFGEPPRAVASAPGRVNLIGEHTDYNGGPVLPIAIAERTTVAVGPGPVNAPGVLGAVSTRYHKVIRVRWQEELPTGWAAYVAGVLRELWALEALPRMDGGGVRIAGASTVPVGAGLASSAALSVAAAKALVTLAGAALTPRQVAGGGFRAGCTHCGSRCGRGRCMSWGRPRARASPRSCSSAAGSNSSARCCTSRTNRVAACTSAARRSSTRSLPRRSGLERWERDSPGQGGAAQ